MKKKLIATAALSAFLCTGITVPAEAAKSVPVTLPAFDVTLNGQIIENDNRQYPLLVYNNITYVPMTYHDCRFLGLETAWNQKDGLGIHKSDLTGAYYDYETTKKNSKRGTAQIASGKIKVNGKEISNAIFQNHTVCFDIIRCNHQPVFIIKLILPSEFIHRKAPC